MSDEDIKQTLLYYYFDVQQSLNWLYGTHVYPGSAMVFECRLSRGARASKGCTGTQR